MYNGIIIADSAPSNVTGYVWIKPLPDGAREWYSFDKDTQQWVLDNTEAAPALVNHTHTSFDDMNFTGTVSADGDAGLTGVKTLGGYKFTFKKGLLTGFEPV